MLRFAASFGMGASPRGAVEHGQPRSSPAAEGAPLVADAAARDVAEPPDEETSGKIRIIL
jgi:hypothetical protein